MTIAPARTAVAASLWDDDRCRQPAPIFFYSVGRSPAFPRNRRDRAIHLVDDRRKSGEGSSYFDRFVDDLSELL
jgi:hypothetical protein